VEAMMRGARYHEAGHAVAAHYHGMKITSVIATDEEWVTNYRRPCHGGWAEAWREAVISLAGQFADQRASWGEIRPESFEAFLADAQGERNEWDVELDEGSLPGDHLSLLEALEKMSREPLGEGLEKSYYDVVKDARELVCNHWAEIEAVALALEENDGYLDGEEVVRLIKACEHRPYKPPPSG
jgi:hypothetical protein